MSSTQQKSLSWLDMNVRDNHGLLNAPMLPIINPSVPIYGNYHGYYGKRPFVTDPRLAVLPKSLFVGKRVLDIGCNEGWVTCEIAQAMGAHRVLGVDIDDTLIQAAWRRRRVAWSLQAPIDDIGSWIDKTDGSSPHPGTKGQTSPNASAQPNYFPASCEHTFGHLPIPSTRDRDPTTFPCNVSFKTANWLENRISEDAGGYDVVVAFSVTKWIHLNGRDEALESFFRKVYSVLVDGGMFVLESQPWETYTKSKRLDTRLKENAATLCLRPENFEGLLREIGFGPAQHLGMTGEGGFRRPIDLYVKR